MAKPIKIWSGTEWVDIAVAVPDTEIYATKTYADSSATAAANLAVSNLIDSAPSSLDTLNELASALNDDENFATTVTNSLAAKAPLSSPTFTGTVTVPTPINSTDAATKGYVDNNATILQPFFLVGV